MDHPLWHVEIEKGCIRSIRSPQDLYAMNWAEGGVLWGTCRGPEGLGCRAERRFTQDGCLEETYTLTNETDFDMFCQEGSVALAVPLNDSYHEADICLKQRCHAHIWCGGSTSWIMGLRMGGEAPHLGLVLTAGALDGYSVERPCEGGGCVSNDRGDFWVHPAPFHLLPGQSCTLRWQLFWHKGKEDFMARLAAYTDAVQVQAEKFILFAGEEAWVASSGTPARVQVDTAIPGEKEYAFVRGEKTTRALFRVLPGAADMLRSRVRFITEKQQCHNAASHLDGAYLIYDNETKRQFYAHVNDYNGGRERVGMGVLTALYLHRHKDAPVRQSLQKYAAYVLRELLDEETGEVFNDCGRDNSYIRENNYNDPWMAVFCMEMYGVDGDACWLHRAVAIMRRFYAMGGADFYAIGIPMTELCAVLAKAGMAAEEAELRQHFIRHANHIAERGLHYPKAEVDYEQSIVAPAVNYLLMGYQLGGGDHLLEAAREQMQVLELFDGMQPDYHMHTVAIRHWDGYWFGKREMPGDTFPHYWSSLSGQAYARYGQITGNEKYLHMGERSLRGPLSLIFEDGSASCAMVYPRFVNGVRAHDYDPWANDQDWGLYFYMKYGANA